MGAAKKNKWKKVLKWTLAVLAFLIICLFAIPTLFSDLISNEIKKGINSNLNTELQFKDSNISFFNHFPSLTFSFEDVNLASAKPFEKDTLINAKELGFGINVFKLIFSDKVVVNETYLTDSNIYLINDAFGRSNYDVYKTTDTTVVAKDTSASDLNLNLRRLKLDNASIHYIDNNNGLIISSHGLNYNGRGGIVNGKLELGSRLNVNSVDVTFNNTDYLNGKQIEAKSFTIYDTENLSVALDKNTISLNDLKVNFNGNLNVFDNGFAYNLYFKTESGSLEKVISALPPKYAEWSKEVSFKGDLEATFNIAGYTGTVPETSAIDKMEIAVTIIDGTVKHNNAAEALEHLQLTLKGDITNDFINLKVDNLDFTLNNERTKGELIINGKADSLYVKSSIQSHLNLNILNQTLGLPDLKFNGILFADITTDGIYEPLTSRLPRTNGIFKLTDGELQTSGHLEPIRDISLDARIQNEGKTYETSTLTIKALNFSFLENQFTSTAFFKNLEQPEYDIRGKGSIDFTALNKVIELPFLITNGQLTADMHLKGQLDNVQTENTNSGTLSLKNLTFTSDMLQYPLIVNQGQFLFLNDKMAFTNLAVKHQSSDMIMEGYFTNYMDYALFSKGVLLGDLQLKAKKLDITEFFPKEEQLITQTNNMTNPDTVESVVSGVMPIPKNVNLAIKVIIDSLNYNNLNISKLSGDLGIKDQGLFLKNSTLSMVDGTAKIEGFYQPTSSKDALFSLSLNAKNLNIEKGYNSMALFKELAPAAAQASGIVSIDYNIAGLLDETMLPVMTSLKGKGTLKVHDVKFDGYKLLGKVSEKSGFDALNDPKVSEITIKSTVDNNVLNIEQFKFKVSPFRLRAEGQTSFDGDLSLKMRIGLPHLGLIGIPVVIEGTSDDFDIKLGKKSKDLNIEDTTESSTINAELEDISKRKDSLRDSQSVNKINTLQNDLNQIKLDSIKTNK